jgi:ABC-type bacteriocin/lantibiotic exporter with double-glycine peptidase domain
MLIMALLDMIGVASILPFMAVLTNPSLVETNLILNKLFQASAAFGVENYSDFLFILGFIVFITLVTSIIFKGLTTYVQVKFIQMREYSISKRLVEGYLRQPYSWFLNRNSTELGKTILSEVSQVIALGLRPILEMTAKALVSIALISLLILSDPKLAMIISTFLGGTYFIIFLYVNILIELEMSV